jgi:hypothetical protein
MRKMIVLGGVAALALSGAAMAQTHGDGQRGSRMDPNARVSQAEFVDQRVARLTAMDANSDGVVSREEMQAGRQARMAERRDSMFERMDADSDGAVTRGEYDASHAQRAERMAERRAERGEAGGRRGGRGHRGGHGAGGEMGMRLDRDGQGVNIEQARQRATEQFGRTDADGDGVVTGAEMRAQHEARRAERQARRAERRAPPAE